MKIRYADGTNRKVEADVDVISAILDRDLSPGWTHTNGLVWATDAESENDDGRNASCEIQDDDGNRVEDFLPNHH